MASDAEIIKEFLVSIGVRTDEATLKKFGGIVGDLGSKAVQVGAALVAAGSAVEAYVAVVSEKFEDLYWASQRLHDSVGNIQDYALEIQNLGGTAEGARSSLENLARLIRTNPGYAGLIANLGINPNQGTVGLITQLGERFKSMPYFIAARYAAALGIDEQTLWAMTHGQLAGLGTGPYSQFYRAGGINADAAAKGAKDFQVQLRTLQAQFTVTAQILETYLLPVASKMTGWAGEGLKTFLELTREIIDEVKTGTGPLGDFTSALKTFVEGIETYLTPLTDWLKKYTPSVPTVAQAAGRGAGAAMHFAAETLRRKGEPPFLNFSTPKEGNTVSWKWSDFTSAVKGLFGSGPKDASSALAYFMSQGWTREQAAAIVAHGKYESGLNPHQTGDSGLAYGIFQLHRDRQALFAKVMGHDIRQSMIGEQMAFAQWELTHSERHAGALLHAAKSAADAVRAFYAFERPKDPGASESARLAIAQRLIRAAESVQAIKPNVSSDTEARASKMGQSITVHAKTDVHVAAGPTAAATGAAVADHQTRVWGDVLRNTKQALQ